jgi:hypothetical protein
VLEILPNELLGCWVGKCPGCLALGRREIAQEIVLATVGGRFIQSARNGVKVKRLGIRDLQIANV